MKAVILAGGIGTRIKQFIRYITAIPDKVYNYITFMRRKPVCTGLKPIINGKLKVLL
jgi:dTDP-glucose pyrophosphorylase